MAPCCGKRVLYTAKFPLILGEDVGESVEVIPSVNIKGMKANQQVWVRGSHLQALIDAGWVWVVPS